ERSEAISVGLHEIASSPRVKPAVPRNDNFYSDRGVAAIDEEVAAADKAGIVAGEVDRGAGDLVGAAEPAGQVLGADRLLGRAKRAIAPQRSPRLDRAGRQRVDPDVLRR